MQTTDSTLSLEHQQLARPALTMLATAAWCYCMHRGVASKLLNYLKGYFYLFIYELAIRKLCIYTLSIG